MQISGAGFNAYSSMAARVQKPQAQAVQQQVATKQTAVSSSDPDHDGDVDGPGPDIDGKGAKIDIRA